MDSHLQKWIFFFAQNEFQFKCAIYTPLITTIQYSMELCSLFIALNLQVAYVSIEQLNQYYAGYMFSFFHQVLQRIANKGSKKGTPFMSHSHFLILIINFRFFIQFIHFFFLFLYKLTGSGSIWHR